MFVCRLLNNPIIAAQLFSELPWCVKRHFLSMQKERSDREKWEREKTQGAGETVWDNLCGGEERGREGEKGRVNEWRRKKPLRDSAAVCVFMWEKEKDRGEGKKNRRESRRQSQSYLYKCTDLVHFTLTSLSKRISLYHSHSAVPNCANWFQWTRNGEIESLVTLAKDQGNTC